MTNHRNDELLADPEAGARAADAGRPCDMPGARLGPLRTPLG
jgi:hypothetical protein